jgi:GntR family transcriptional regulator of vanillate catabolism
MRELQSQMDRIVHATIERFADYVRLNETFHFELVRLAKSPMLERSLNHLNTLPFAGPSKLVFARMTVGRGAELLVQGHQQHHRILEAIANRKPAEAEALVREHIGLARINLGAALENAEIWRDVPGAQLIQRDMVES